MKKEDRYKNMKNQSPTKQIQGPVIEVEEHSQKYNELLSYDNMKEYAKTYIRSKRSWSDIHSSLTICIPSKI